jgi:hypothetical protein
VTVSYLKRTEENDSRTHIELCMAKDFAKNDAHMYYVGFQVRAMFGISTSPKAF